LLSCLRLYSLSDELRYQLAFYFLRQDLRSMIHSNPFILVDLFVTVEWSIGFYYSPFLMFRLPLIFLKFLSMLFHNLVWFFGVKRLSIATISLSWAVLHLKIAQFFASPQLCYLWFYHVLLTSFKSKSHYA